MDANSDDDFVQNNRVHKLAESALKVSDRSKSVKPKKSQTKLGFHRLSKKKASLYCPVCSLSCVSVIELESHANQCCSQQEKIHEKSAEQNENELTICMDEDALKLLRRAGCSHFQNRFEELQLTSIKQLQSLDESFIVDFLGTGHLNEQKRLHNEIQSTIPNTSNQQTPPEIQLQSTKSISNSNKTTLWPISWKPKSSPPTNSSVIPSKSPLNPRNHASWKKVPATTFTVDSFNAQRGFCRQFFLSHFHYDHYIGLSSKSFTQGKIYCSQITAALLTQELRISPESIIVLPLNTEIDINDEGIPESTLASSSNLSIRTGLYHKRGATVTLLDANHCPGSVMFLFRVWSTNKTILHTGDCRYDSNVMQHQHLLLNALENSRLDYLFLDTTYCNEKYQFPKQRDVIDAVCHAAKSEAFNPKTVFIAGSYTIGKERVFLELARELKLKIHVSRQKYNILKCLDLDDEIMNFIDYRKPLESKLWIVPMKDVSFKSMNRILETSRGRFSNAIGIRPTGWTWTNKKEILMRTSRGNCVIYNIPYSEHSSFSELQEFVRFCNPIQLIPTVGSASSHEAMRNLLLSYQNPIQNHRNQKSHR
uniref:DNA repair metallo-beta-lactamase domain-containing protein n=1 Tax=Timspurckia oligopyrenoides TaxID=708627 RepID=A0A7S1EV46_9RHOD|mmetsp:Transcript_9808/g.17687  ORF Transcript_9808/g.17687 Transcript_9808/m.17687 type:complete len:594 (+) Transcript_9808:116-1897(+)